MGQGIWFNSFYDHLVLVDESLLFGEVEDEEDYFFYDQWRDDLWENIRTAFGYNDVWKYSNGKLLIKSNNDLEPDGSDIYVPSDFIPKLTYDRFTLGVHGGSDAYVIAAIPHLYESSAWNYKAYQIYPEMVKGFNRLIRDYAPGTFYYSTTAYTGAPYGKTDKGWVLYQHTSHAYYSKQGQNS